MKRFIALLIGGLISCTAFAQGTEKKSMGICYVDIDYVLSQMPESKLAQQKMQETQAGLRSEYEQLQKRLQTDYQAYQQNVGSMADSTRVKTENYLNGLNAELQEFPQQAQQSMENANKLFMITAQLKIENAIRQISAENNYQLIIPVRLGQQGLILYADQSRNVSNLVLEKVLPKEGEQTPEQKKN